MHLANLLKEAHERQRKREGHNLRYNAARSRQGKITVTQSSCSGRE